MTLLRDFGRITDGAGCERGGRVVKRLGDGAMAVFADAGAAVEAARHACRGSRRWTWTATSPRCVPGCTSAARATSAATTSASPSTSPRAWPRRPGGRVLISEPARERLPPDAYPLRKRRRFKAKGAPGDLAVYAVGLVVAASPCLPLSGF